MDKCLKNTCQTKDKCFKTNELKKQLYPSTAPASQLPQIPGGIHQIFSFCLTLLLGRLCQDESKHRTSTKITAIFRESPPKILDFFVPAPGAPLPGRKQAPHQHHNHRNFPGKSAEDSMFFCPCAWSALAKTKTSTAPAPKSPQLPRKVRQIFSIVSSLRLGRPCLDETKHRTITKITLISEENPPKTLGFFAPAPGAPLPERNQAPHQHQNHRKFQGKSTKDSRFFRSCA